MASTLDVVTGAFGYSGQYITRRLLDAGRQVRTLTNSLHRDSPLQPRVEAKPLAFDNPQQLRESLQGVDVLYNTYWLRFNDEDGHARALRNTRVLFEAARDAGVRRIVHVSITNPDPNSELTYFSGKARVEELLKGCGVSYAILRPAILFGEEDILINNIAWTLRHLPVVPMFGDGRYKIQPIHVNDLAELAVRLGGESENVVVNAIGPETYEYRELMQMVARQLGLKRVIVPMPRYLTFAGSWAVGKLFGDIVTTREEMVGLMSGRLYVEGAPPAGKTRLSEWVREHRDRLGRKYANELSRRKNRDKAYEKL